MKLRVSHLSRYEYAQEVAFSPHTLFLRPREQSGLRLLEFSLNVNPNAKIVWTRDPADNPVALAWFWDRSPVLSIRTEFVVDTYETNPFDFILHSHAANFPFAYKPAEAFALGTYLAPPYDNTQRVLSNWLDEHFMDRPTDTVSMLSALNDLVYQTLRYNRREERGIQPSVQTLELGSGTCRDYAVLFIEMCRTLGFAARFASGYLYDPPAEMSQSQTGQHQTAADRHATNTMHAWAEVFLPGGGWKGLDPTNGSWCADSHVPVAVAAQAETINPVQGSYYAQSPVASTLHTDVFVEKIS